MLTQRNDTETLFILIGVESVSLQPIRNALRSTLREKFYMRFHGPQFSYPIQEDSQSVTYHDASMTWPHETNKQIFGSCLCPYDSYKKLRFMLHQHPTILSCQYTTIQIYNTTGWGPQGTEDDDYHMAITIKTCIQMKIKKIPIRY